MIRTPRPMPWAKFFTFSILLLMLGLQTTFAQSTIQFESTKQSLDQIVQTIQEQTDYQFLYSEEDVAPYQQIDLGQTSHEKSPIYLLLNQIIKQTQLEYKLEENTIIFSKKEGAMPVAKPTPVLQMRTIKGVIMETGDLPLPGAAVMQEGSTSNGTITDFDGNFTLKVPDSPDTKINISFIGLETQILPIGNQTEFKITLQESALKIEEVVVTGYQKIDRKLFTGSAVTMKAEDVVSKGTPDLANNLQGKVAGVQVSTVSSSFGSAPRITIRGNSSINGSNKPLWVIDGVELEDLVNVSADDLTSGNLNTLLSSGVAGLNQDDIKSIEVLKDVSATALYGAKAMNGVIVVTTKQGKKGKLNFNYSSTITRKDKPSYNNFDIMNSGEELSVYRQLVDYGHIDLTTVANAETYGSVGKMFENIYSGKIPWGPNGTINENFLEQYGRANTDWFDVLFKNGMTHQHALSMSGGTENSNYYASVSFFEDMGYTIADEVKKYTANLRMSFKPVKAFKVGLKLTANIRDQKVPGTKDRVYDAIQGRYSRDFDISPFSYALNTSRSIRPRDQQGNLEYFRRSYAPFNILYELEHNNVFIKVQDVSMQNELEYKFKPDLTANATFQMRRASTENAHKIHETSNQAQAYRAAGNQAVIDGNRLLFNDPSQPNSNPYSVLPEGGFYNTISNSLEHLYGRFTVNWSPRFGADHALNFMYGTEINHTDRESVRHDGWGISYDKGNIVTQHPNLSRYLIENGQTLYSLVERRERRVSAFATNGYTYKGRYIFNGSFRVDGSNQLGSSPSARYLPSWNVSGAWNLSSEPFMKQYKKMNKLRFKASYGLNGIMGPNSSAELAIYTNNTVRPSDNEAFNFIASLENKNLTWEKMFELNLGLEFAFFDNRLSGEIGHYRRTSKDLIDVVTTSGVGGYALKYGNIGNMDSEGYEFFLTGDLLRAGDFTWNASANVNFHYSDITKLESFASIGDATSNLGAPVLGFPQRGLFSVRFAGLDEKGIPTFYGRDNQIVKSINLQDRNKITEILHYEGSLAPTSYGGLTNTFSYGNFSLKVNIVYRWGNVIRLDDAFKSSYTDFDSFSKQLKNRWMLPGDEKRTNIPAILDQRTARANSSNNAYELFNKSTERVAKGDFIRLKEVGLSYSLPLQWLQASFLNTASLSAQVTNLMLLYSDDKLRGMDPEFFSSGGVALPPARMYSVSINLGF